MSKGLTDCVTVDFAPWKASKKTNDRLLLFCWFKRCLLHWLLPYLIFSCLTAPVRSETIGIRAPSKALVAAGEDDLVLVEDGGSRAAFGYSDDDTVRIGVTPHRQLAGLTPTNCGRYRTYLITALLAFRWNSIDANRRQVSIVPERSNNRMRIDLQGNADTVPTGFTGLSLPPGQNYRQLAAQYGSDSYAGVWVPVGVTIPNYVLNRALYYSALHGRVVIFLPSATTGMTNYWRLWDHALGQFVNLNESRYPSGRRLSSSNTQDERDLQDIPPDLTIPDLDDDDVPDRNIPDVDDDGDVDDYGDVDGFGIFDVSKVQQCPIEEWSPCYSNQDAYDAGLRNRDAAGAAFCRVQGYAGVKPNGYQACSWASSYKFECAPLESKTVSPCYRDEDAEAMNIASGTNGYAAVKAGAAFCRYLGHDGSFDNKSCGNWYYKSYCYKVTPCIGGFTTMWYQANAQATDFCKQKGFEGYFTWNGCGFFKYRYVCGDDPAHTDLR